MGEGCSYVSRGWVMADVCLLSTIGVPTKDRIVVPFCLDGVIVFPVGGGHRYSYTVPPSTFQVAVYGHR